MASRRVPALTSGLLLLTLAACGGESHSGAGAGGGPQAARSPTCPPREARLPEAPRKRVAVGRPVGVDLPKPSGGTTQLEITVQGARTRSGVEDTFTNKGRFRTASTDRFVAVNFSFENKGDGRIEAANSVNKTFVIEDGQGRAWRVADGVAKCGVVSPSAAFNAGRTSPESDIDRGQSYDTTALYVVPRVAQDLSWVGPDVSFPIKPR